MGDSRYAVYLASTCGEEQLNELWAHAVNEDKWFYFKPEVDVNNDQVQIPYPRHSHSATLVEADDFEDKPKLRLLKKYLYIFGGFSMYCEMICSDMWFYEIPYGPMRLYPRNVGTSDDWEAGNKWTQVIFTSTENPGYRAGHTMFTDSSNKFIFLYGGYGQESLNSDALVFKDDMWRLSILNKNWEEINGLGIEAIRRQIRFWDGTVVTITNVKPEDIKPTDEVEFEPVINAREENIPIEYPEARSHANIVLGGPFDRFLMVMGGFKSVGKPNSANPDVDIELKDVLEDMWVFSLLSLKWKKIYPNSTNNPLKRFGSSVSVKN